MTKATILVVDNEPKIRDLVRLILEEAGYEVFTASYPNEAIRKAEDEIPDFTLLDAVMPVKNGFEVDKYLKLKNRTKFIRARSCAVDLKGLWRL